MTLIKFAYVGEFTSRRRRVGVGEFARRRVDRIPFYWLSTKDLSNASATRKIRGTVARSHTVKEKFRNKSFHINRNVSCSSEFIF